MSKKKIISGLIVVALGIVLALGASVAKPEKQLEDKALQEKNEAVQQDDTEETQVQTPEDSDDQKTDENEAGEEKRDNANSSDPTSVEPTEQGTENPVQDIPKEEGQKMEFPYQIPDTDIVVKYLSGYDGIYVEDGSDEKLKNVTAILVQNNSKDPVEYGTISFRAGEQKLEFSFSALPAGKSCIVMEINKTSYDSSWELQYGGSDFAYTDQLSKLESDVSLKVGKKNDITITNLTDDTLPRIRIFYKYQLESGEYVGGITYTCKVDDLEGNESRTIYPSHFSSEGSVVMMVRKYEDKNE